MEITTPITISKWFCEISIWITPLLSDRYCRSRRFLHKVSLCCFLLLLLVAWLCLWPVWWGGLTVSIGLCEGLKQGLGYWTEHSVGAASALASQGLLGFHACVCIWMGEWRACVHDSALVPLQTLVWLDASQSFGLDLQTWTFSALRW